MYYSLLPTVKLTLDFISKRAAAVFAFAIKNDFRPEMHRKRTSNGRTSSKALTDAIIFILLALVIPRVVSAQTQQTSQQSSPAAPQTQQTPARTGRSYDVPPPSKRASTSAPQQPSPVVFSDVTARVGVNFRHAASPTSQKYLPETMGGGVALLDFDDDGRLDIYFTNGAALQDPMSKSAAPDKRDAKYWNRLYRQKADGTFEDATERAGVRGSGYSMGAAAADYDGDGYTDLFVTGYGSTILFRNRGDGTFEDVTAKANANVAGWSTSAGWFDYDRDGRLDLFVARYIEWDFERGSLFCGDPRYRAYCHPDNFKGASNVLLRQKADGTFEDASVKAGISVHEGKALGVVFADFDDDGDADVFVANDSVRQFLFRNRGDGSFDETALEMGAGYDENGRTFAGMGVDAADFDNDGHVDVIVTALSNETYPLFRNNGDESFTYVTQTEGVGSITLPFSGWGVRFVDVDNDGLRDIIVAQSHVLDTIEKTSGWLAYRQPPLVMRNTGRGFVNVSASAGAAFNSPLAARGAAFGDLDNDGDADVVFAQTDGPPVVLRNEGTKNHWLGVELAGAKGKRHGFGARITVTDSTGRRQIFDVNATGSYLSSNDARIIAGLGSATSVRAVEVRWPSGKMQTIENPPIDKYLTINEK